MSVAATVGGARSSSATSTPARRDCASTALASALPRPGTSEGRQLRRWLTQVLVTARLVATEAETLGVTADGAPTEDDLLPDAARPPGDRQRGGGGPRGRRGTGAVRPRHAGVTVGDDAVADYHTPQPLSLQRSAPPAAGPPTVAPALEESAQRSPSTCSGSARRRAFRSWLDARRAELVQLAPGYEHPGDPRQPDNTHRH